MSELTVVTYDWVPMFPRGLVRDLRVRWALEEAGLGYRVRTVPFKDRSPTHLEHQPFGQVPWLEDGGRSIFESGAILIHLGARSEVLLPADPEQRSQAIQWVFAALNSVEMASLPWSRAKWSSEDEETPGFKSLDAFLTLRLERLEPVLAGREWLAGPFSIADILMADTLRLIERFDRLATFPACRSYVARATSRPAFLKARADQLAHFAAAD